MAKITTEQIIEALGGMTAVELNDLSKAIQDHFGIEGMPTMVAGGAGDGDGGEAASSEFDVKIKDVGAQKMAVIKFVKGFANLGLKEAKDYVDDDGRKSVGDLLGKSFKKEEAEKLVADLKEVGASAETMSK